MLVFILHQKGGTSKSDRRIIVKKIHGFFIWKFKCDDDCDAICCSA
jgi:hypothetical protein